MDKFIYTPISVGVPGEIVLEYLESQSWTQSELARRAGMTRKTINEVCNGKAKITPATALAFEKTLGRPAHFWLTLQVRYDEAKERQLEREKSNDWDAWAKQFPIAEMKKRGWLPKARGANPADLLKYLGVSSPDSWNSVWKAQQVAFRQTRAYETNDYAISAWLRSVELGADKITVEDFNENLLLDALYKIKACTRRTIDEALDEIEQILAQCGVALVLAPELPKTGISGCTRWVNKKKAIIALTLRYKWDDQIWFTLFHELGHVLLHRGKYTLILDNPQDQLTDIIIDPEMRGIEEEANRFAADIMIPPQLLQEFLSFGVVNSEYIEKFAQAVGISPGIVVGRLQYEGVLEPHMGNALKQRVDWTYEVNGD